MKLSRAINILELKILEYQKLSKVAREESENTDNFKKFINKIRIIYIVKETLFQ